MGAQAGALKVGRQLLCRRVAGARSRVWAAMRHCSRGLTPVCHSAISAASAASSMRMSCEWRRMAGDGLRQSLAHRERLIALELLPVSRQLIPTHCMPMAQFSTYRWFHAASSQAVDKAGGQTDVAQQRRFDDNRKDNAASRRSTSPLPSRLVLCPSRTGRHCAPTARGVPGRAMTAPVRREATGEHRNLAATGADGA